MESLFGHTRDAVSRRYALFTPAGFVSSNLAGWKNAECVVAISVQLGAMFSQFLIRLNREGEGAGETGVHELFVYILEGEAAAGIRDAGQGAKEHSFPELSSGAYLYVPPHNHYHFSARPSARLLIFQKNYKSLAGTPAPNLLTGHERDIAGQPFMGNADALLQPLLPDDFSFDMAVNIFTYQPGATLPLVESHVMEHGLLMLKGQGIYRLDRDWHPVREGDVIWMAPYCSQWFVAMGREPAAYIYYKDVNREGVGMRIVD